MRKAVFAIWVFASILVWGCRKDETLSQLSMIDRMLTSKQNDSAYAELQKINIEEIDDEEIKACYWLYWLQAQHRLRMPINSVSPLDISISYFKEKGDKEKLARAYYYKGTICEELGDKKEAIINLKKAEEIVSSGKTRPWLTYAVYSGLAYMNNDNKDLAVYYGKQALVYGYQLNDSSNLAYDLLNLSAAYNNSGQRDSFEYYIERFKELIKTLPIKERSNFYCTIGISLKKTPEKAKEYLNEAIKISPNPYAYKALGRIYKSEGNREMAYEMLQKALCTDNLQLKANTLQEIYEMKHGEGDFKAASEIAQHIAALKDSIEKQKREEDLQGVQERMNHQAKEDVLKEKNSRYVRLTAAALLAVAAVILLSLVRQKKLRHIIDETSAGISQRDEQIEDLTHRNRQHQQAMHQQQQELEQRQQQMKRQQQDMTAQRSTYEKRLSAGRLLYERLLDGETTVAWSKKDMEHFISYYRIIDQPFMDSLDINYTDLTDRQRIFAILEHMGKTDEEMGILLGIGTGTLRTSRYRMREKRKVKSEE